MVDVESEGGVTRIFLNRPEKVNALHSALLDSLLKTFHVVAENREIRVVVLGADVHELSALTAANAGGFVQKIHAVCQAIRRLPLPVVARLHGAVIGAGLEIAAACDLRIAAEGTRFSMPEVRLGIPSVVEAALLPRLMGSGRAAWLVLAGEAIDARRAREWGLIEEVGGDDAVDALVRSLMKNDPGALRMQKQLLQLWEEAPLSESIAKSIEYFAGAYADGVGPGLTPKLRR